MKIHHMLGFTLTELLITIAVVGILAAIAIPSFTATLQKNKISQAAEGIRNDLSWAKTVAIKESCPIAVEFVTGAEWSYSITPCLDGERAQGDIGQVVIDSTTLADDTVSYDFRRGESNTGSILLSTSLYSLNIAILSSYEMTICSPITARSVGAYSAC